MEVTESLSGCDGNIFLKAKTMVLPEWYSETHVINVLCSRTTAVVHVILNLNRCVLGYFCASINEHC